MAQLARQGRWTIDQLAAVSGTTSRNLRAFQSRGLLPRPNLAGRTGRYDEGHRTRLEAVLRLQRRGYSLAAIADLSAAWERGATLEEVLGFGDVKGKGAGTVSKRQAEADVVFLDEIRQWRVPKGSALALLPGTLLPS